MSGHHPHTAAAGRLRSSPGALPARDHAQPGTCLAGRPAGADAFVRTQEVHHYRAGCPAPPDPGMPTPGTFVPDAATQRFHPGAHLRVTPGPGSVPSVVVTTPTPAGGKGMNAFRLTRFTTAPAGTSKYTPKHAAGPVPSHSLAAEEARCPRSSSSAKHTGSYRK